MRIQPAQIVFDTAGNARSDAFDDIYYNPGKASVKTEAIFHRATCLPELIDHVPADRPIVVGELGFGLGVNFLGTWALMRQRGQGRRLHYLGIDVAPPSMEQLRLSLRPFEAWRDLAEALIAHWPGRVAGVHRMVMPGATLTLHMGDVAEAMAGMTGKMDAWFLDGFAPEKNPQMWDTAVFKRVAAHTRPGGRLGSFTAAGHVRRALKEAGFEVERLDGSPLKRHIVTAKKPDDGTGGQSNRHHHHVAVIGSGWAGMSVAESLLERGKRVSLIDAVGPGAGASGHEQALCAPVLDAAESARQDWYRSAFVLAARRHRQCGVLRHPDKNKTADTLRKAAATFGALDPLIVEDAKRGGWWIPTAGVAHFDTFAAAVTSRLDARNRRWPTTVSMLERDAEGWRLVTTSGETIEANTVVLACAGAVRRFGVAASWPVSLVRGQTSRVRATATSDMLDYAVSGRAYVCPSRDGWHTVGATFDPGDQDPVVQEADHLDNRKRAMETAPHWAGAMDWSSVRGRVGFRCTSADYMPIVGAVMDEPASTANWNAAGGPGRASLPLSLPIPGLYAVTALASHGVISSALAGEVVADLIDGTPLPCSSRAVAAVHPGRFAVRAARCSEGR